ncbi:MAG: hypothetical protein NWQ16_13210 [Akkermansiaceae bacterium]|nr:hypothetical protein [Akkermansiaceae bacterium]
MEKIPGLSLNPDPSTYSSANRKVNSCPVQSIYPWLLFASTAIAATFCLAYITKPYIIEGPSNSAIPEQREVSSNTPAPKDGTGSLLPSADALPGENSPSPSPVGGAPAASGADFEETNIRVQHVLDAESPSGDISRIIVDVPVLYRSRNLRWTQQEAAEARELLARLSAHQERTRALRDEGAQLLSAWNDLMDHSVPTAALRADSPSLPANQYDPLAPVGSSAADTIETIELQNPQD